MEGQISQCRLYARPVYTPGGLGDLCHVVFERRELGCSHRHTHTLALAEEAVVDASSAANMVGLRGLNIAVSGRGAQVRASVPLQRAVRPCLRQG